MRSLRLCVRLLSFFSGLMQEIQIVLALKEHCLTVIAAIIEVIILVGQKRCVSAGHGILWVSGASDLRVLKELGGLVHRVLCQTHFIFNDHTRRNNSWLCSVRCFLTGMALPCLSENQELRNQSKNLRKLAGATETAAVAHVDREVPVAIG